MIAKETRNRIIIGIAVIGLLCAFQAAGFYPLEELENRLFDLNFRLRGPLPPPENIVIAAIDEKSIAQLGRWPWGRDRLAGLVHALTEAGADLVVFDVLFSETESHDPALAGAMDEAGNVLLPVVFSFDGQKARPLPAEALASAFPVLRHPEAFRHYPPITAGSVLAPVPELAGAAMGFGHINMFPDEDGVVRWEALVIGYQGRLFPSLPLQAAATYLGIPPEDRVVDGARGIALGTRFLPTDPWGRALIPWYGPGRTFPHLSIADIMAGAVPREQLARKIVLIGASAVGIYDLRVTPFAAAMPGVEKHASVIASILDGRTLCRISPAARFAELIGVGLLIVVLLSRLGAAGGGLTAGAALALLMGAGYLFFTRGGIWIDIAYPANAILWSFTGITAYNYTVEERKARRIRGMFSSYVTERIVNELIRHPEMARLGGSRREVTVLFSDIRGFTSLSERLTPEEVVGQLNEYLAAMTEVIFSWEGTLDKFIGDAIVAFWGAPIPQDDHAERALRCAIQMSERLAELQEKWRAEGKAVLETGVGINSGEVLVGNIGAENRKMDYTVIGDHVNLGARVEGLTRKYDVQIIITGFTLEKVRPLVESGNLGHLHIRGLDTVIVKGKEKPVEIYELRPLDPGTASIVELCELRQVVHLTEK